MFRLSNYLALCLLILIPYAFYLSKKSLADLSSWRRWSTFGLRSVIILLLILSLAGLKLVWKTDRLCVMFALDVSNSIPESEVQGALGFIGKSLEGMKEEDEAGLIVFGKEAYVEVPPKPYTAIPSTTKISSEPSREYTNISAAIGTATDLFPEAVQKRIVLLTDGNENTGNAMDKAMLAKSSGVQIYTVPLPARGEGAAEVLAESLICPGGIEQGRTFELKAIVKSNVNGNARLKLWKDGNYSGEKEVELSSSRKNIFAFPQVLNKEGTYLYEVLIEPIADTIRENNRAKALVIASGKPKVLYVAGDSNQASYLYKALSQRGIEVTLLTDPSMIPASLSEMQNYSAIIFDNIPANSLSTDRMKMIERYVHDLGGGFVMVGGENSFGSGGYHKTPIEEILPVKVIPEQKKRSLSIVLAIDRSGSMAAVSGRSVKIDLAKEAAISVVEFLTDRDQIGVIAFDAEAKEIVNLEKAVSKGKIEDKIAAIQPRGGTNIFPALEIAHRWLKGADTQLKHVILVSDGISQQPAESYNLTKRMAQDKITVSTIAIGDDADKKLMRDMANAGSGRYYETADAGDLPGIFIKEAFAASKLIMEGDFRPVVSGSSEMLKGMDTKFLPHLYGYVGTSPKENSSVLISSDQGDPILSAWQYGLGRAVAFTSDAKPKWAVEWLKWDQFSKFWSQVAGWSLAMPSGEFDASATIAGGMGHVTVDAVDASGRFRNFLNFQANVVRPDLSHDVVPLRQSGPGRYEAEFDSGQMGTYMLHVSEVKDKKPASSQNIGAVVSYSPEYKDLERNYSLLESLAAIANGKFKPEIGDIALHSEANVWRLQELWRMLLIASIPLFFLDIALRRITISREQIAELKSRIHLPGREEIPRAETATLASLKARKASMLKGQTSLLSWIPGTSALRDARTIQEVKTPAEDTIQHIRTAESTEAYTSRLLEAKKRAARAK